MRSHIGHLHQNGFKYLLDQVLGDVDACECTALGLEIGSGILLIATVLFIQFAARAISAGETDIHGGVQL